MKRRKPIIKFNPGRVQLSNEEIMRDLLFPAPQQRQDADRRRTGSR